MSLKMSVIIPVYNADKYIVPCLESLISQTLQECEFICINDGSKDNSRQIIESYQRLDGRVKLINQDNQGVSAARNAGLRIAAGEYIGFVDADDYVEKDMFETLYRSATEPNHSDAVISNYETELGGHKAITKYPFPVATRLDREYIERELLPYFLKTEHLNTVWNKIYKRTLIEANGVTFPDRVALGEDAMFNIRFFDHAATMKYVDYTGYHYREVEGSATRNIAEKDYFKRSLEVFTMEFPNSYIAHMEQGKARELKSIKLIRSVMSYIDIYFEPNKDLSLRKRYTYVNNMIRNPYVRESLSVYNGEMYQGLNRYERFLIDMIKRKSTIGLYCAAAYSRFRNR
jgi:glycosyltransferase involved in cell wall biosynthesis